MKPTTEEHYLSITDYASLYAVDRSTVYKWLSAGLLEHYRVERVVRIRNVPPGTTIHVQAASSTSAGAC